MKNYRPHHLFFTFVCIVYSTACLYAHLKILDSPSDRYICRWAFEELCDHIYDPRVGEKDWPSALVFPVEKLSFDPEKVKAGDVIFVRKFDKFYSDYSHTIKNPYIIVTHGDFLEYCAEEYSDALEDTNIIAAFCIHPPRVRHPKLFPIPLGVQPDPTIFDRKEVYAKKFRALRKKEKAVLASVTFKDGRREYVHGGVPNHIDRALAFDAVANTKFCLVHVGDSFDRYLETLGSCKFTISPRGWGPDCYRTWEALLAGSIPVVKKCQYGLYERARVALRSPSSYDREGSNLDDLYEGLPVLVIDDWHQLTEEYLESAYKHICSQEYTLEKLYMPYWEEKIRSVRDAFFTRNAEKEVATHNS